jgi:2-polyprenyl-6-methoxyphenol hydroxylase-like FAD-dependent oxidoreductase
VQPAAIRAQRRRGRPYAYTARVVQGAGLADAVVSGGGIGGAVLAELLARQGKRVIVLERNTVPPSFLRPELLWPASIELLCALHPRSTWEDEVARPVGGVIIKDGREPLAALTGEILREAGVHPWFVNPNDARELLLRRASFEVRRGFEVVSVLRDGGRVAGVRARERESGAEQDVLAAYTIGDDGERSVVRQGCGIELETRPFPLEFLCWGVDWPARLDPAVARAWIHPGARASGILALLAMPFVHGRGAGLVAVRGGVFDARPDHDAAWRALCALDQAIPELVGPRVFPRDMARIRRSFGHARRYGAPGAFLLGDAAHPVSPAGGQGANMSIADARVLASVLGGSDPLREYERVRRPANERSVRISRFAARALSLHGPLVSRAAFFLARRLLRRRAVVKRLLRIASRSFVER